MKKIFLKLNILAFALFFCASCQTPNTDADTEDKVVTDNIAVETTSNNTAKDTTTIYRCDGFRPNIASEWLSVKSSKMPPKLLEIWYWSSADEKKVQFEIVSQDFKEGEFSGYIGKIRLPNDTTSQTFGLLQEHFNIGFGEDGQEFVHQKTLK